MLSAIIASFTSSEVVTSPEYYTKDLGVGFILCVQTSGPSCNSTNVNHPICKFRYINFDATLILSAVYDDISVDNNGFTACDNPLRHSANGGVINP